MQDITPLLRVQKESTKVIEKSLLQKRTRKTRNLPTPWQSRNLRSSKLRYPTRRANARHSYKFQALQHIIQTEQYQNNIFHPRFLNHIFDETGKKLSLDKLLAGPHAKDRWSPALSNEMG